MPIVTHWLVCGWPCRRTNGGPLPATRAKRSMSPQTLGTVIVCWAKSAHATVGGEAEVAAMAGVRQWSE
jgi:hypothetical protein